MNGTGKVGERKAVAVAVAVAMTVTEPVSRAVQERNTYYTTKYRTSPLHLGYGRGNRFPVIEESYPASGGC